MTATLAAPTPTGLRPEPEGPPAAVGFTPSAEQQRVVRHSRGRLKVLAGPGTGKTATIAAAVAARIADGADPASILVLTFARRAAAELASRTAGLVEVTTVEPTVRTLHSYCYSLVRLAADAHGESPPRMLAAGETDLVVRDLLAGQVEAGAAGWPEQLRGALSVPGFAAELRNVMLRCAEREITPSRLVALARRHRRPEWRAVANFITEYREVTSLRAATGRSGAALDQAELTVAALEQLGDPEVLAAQQRRIRRIFVDEYQDVDPAQARLIDLLATGADELVVVGDPDQAIFGFRGAVAGAMSAIEVDETVALTQSRRLPPLLVQASRRVADRIPGPVTHRGITAVAPGPSGASLEVRVLPRTSAEAAFVADQLRRAHLTDGVPWSQMAVLMRSPAASAARIRGALMAAGVPVAGGPPSTPLADQPVVRALLAILRSGVDP
ncbi:MAG TPA: ATP-dependent helicase, partial [Nakamurella sp.]